MKTTKGIMDFIRQEVQYMEAAADLSLDEWEKFLENVFGQDEPPFPKKFVWKGILHIPQPDGRYKPPLPEDFKAIIKRLAEGKMEDPTLNSNMLNVLFYHRTSVVDPQGMQIFRTPHQGPISLFYHSVELLRALFYSRRVVVQWDGGDSFQTMAGMISQVAEKGAEPKQWHIEYLEDRWFKEQATSYEGSEILTECRLVIDGWNESEKIIVDPNDHSWEIDPKSCTVEEMLKKLQYVDDPAFGLFSRPMLEAMTDPQRQCLYEFLHDKYGCKIYSWS